MFGIKFGRLVVNKVLRKFFRSFCLLSACNSLDVSSNFASYGNIGRSRRGIPGRTIFKKV